MNRKIKYLFFLVSFITVNMAILVLVVLLSIVLNELVLTKIQIIPLGFVYFVSLSFCVFISLFLHRKLYRYAEHKWHIHRIFDFNYTDDMDL